MDDKNKYKNWNKRQEGELPIEKLLVTLERIYPKDSIPGLLINMGYEDVASAYVKASS